MKHRPETPRRRQAIRQAAEIGVMLILQVLLVASLAHVAGPLPQMPVLLAVTVVVAGYRTGVAGAIATGLGARWLPPLLMPMFRLHAVAPRPVAPSTLVSLSLAYLVLGLLAAVHAERARQNEKLLAAHEQIGTTLETARRVQSGLLPDAVPSDPRFSMAVYHDTATTLSGDFYDVRLVGDRLHLCVADVSGKGPAAALVSSMLRGVFEMQRELKPPAETLVSINRRIHRFLPDDMFITCFCAQLDLHTGELLYASAGHETMFLRRGDGSVVELGSTGLPLGLEEDTIIDGGSAHLRHDDLLVLYTDGLTNAPLHEGVRLGDEAVCRAVGSFSGNDVEGLSRHLSTLTPALSASTQDDDVVIMAIARRRAPSELVRPTLPARALQRHIA